MAKKVILKDDNVEIMPITRGELVLDSSGQLAFHSAQFLATQSLPGLMSVEDKTKLDSLEKITVEDKKVEQVNTTTNSSYRILFSNSADNETKTEGARKSAKLLFNPYTGALTATALIGKLDWSNLNGVPEDFTPTQHIHNTLEITALTNYSKASSASDLATTDTLNVALGKLEYKADIAYTWYKSITDTDTDDVINKWSEVVDFVNNLENDILDTFVTTNTKQTITGEKTFSGTNALLLTIDRNSSNPAWIRFMKNGTLLGYLGVSNDNKALFNNGSNTYDILHSGNSYIKNGVITINGANITPITSHQSLANYVTLNGKQDITGEKTFKVQQKFTVAQGTSPFTVTSTTTVANLSAALLDGTSKAGLLTDFANVNTENNPNSVSITVGGTTKYLVIDYAKISGKSEKVTCTELTSNNTRPIVVTNKSNGLYYSTKVTLNYSTGNVTAPTFTGDLIGNANSATTASKLSTVSKTAWGLTYWTSGGIPTDISGDMTGVGNINITSNGNVDRFITFDTASTRSWRIGYLGTGSGDANYLTFQSTKTSTAADGWYDMLKIGCETGNAILTGLLTAKNFVSGDGINDFSAGTVKLEVLNIPTSSEGTTFGPGSKGQVLKSNGTTVYWASDGNSTYAVYGKTIDSSYKTAYRTLTKGNTTNGYYISAIRCDTASVAEAPLYGTGLAFGMADTHGYLYMDYYSNNAYIGAGNADKLNWTATLLHSGNSSVSGDGGSTWGSSITVKINGTSKTLTIPSNPNTHWTTRIYAGNSGTAANEIATNPYLKVTDDNTYRNLVRFKGGGTCSISSDASGNITISGPTKTSELTNDSGFVTGGPYLPLAGGTITGTLTIKRAASVIKYIHTDNTVYGYLGFNAKDIPVAYMGDGSTVYNLLHSGNSSVTGEGGSTWGSSITVKINGVEKTLTIPAKPSSNIKTLTFSAGTFAETTYNGSADITVNIPSTFNHIKDATSVSVTSGTVKRKVIVTNVKSEGYISRASIGLSNPANKFSPVIIGVGTNDGGTTFTDYYFDPEGAITDSKGNTYAKTSEIAVVKQNNTTTNSDYRVLLSYSANDTTETKESRKSKYLKFNPSTGVLTTNSWTTSNLNLVSDTSGGKDLGMRVTGSSYSLGFIIGSGNTNRGIYDYTNSAWMLYAGTGAVCVPSWASKGSATLPVYFNASGLPVTCNAYPSVGNGTVTIKQAGVSKGSFTMNQSSATTIELTDTNTWRPITNSYSGTATDTSLSLKGANDLYNALLNGYASSSGYISGGSITNLNSPTTWSSNGGRLVYDIYSGSASNKPVSLDNANGIITLFKGKHGTTGQYVTQIAAPDNGRLYVRYSQGGSWLGWSTVAFTSDIPSIPSITATTTGSGNAITSVSASGHTITFTKGSTFLTSHLSLANCLRATAWVNNPGQDANNMTNNTMNFTYANNAPYTGPIIYFAGASGGLYGIQMNATYNGGGYNLAFRTRNGDNGTWNSWHRLARAAEIPTKTSLLTNDSGFLTSRGYWANVAVSASSSTSTYPTFANMKSTGRIYAGEWIEFSGNTGLYWPNTYGAHFYPNNTSTYGQFKLLGSKGDYSGILFGSSTSFLTVMSTATHHGLYHEGGGIWEFYYNSSSKGVGIRTSTITKNFNVSGLSYLSSNTWIGTTSGSEMLNVGGWVGTVGNTGWYSVTHTGGWYMIDSTYVRVYNNKSIYTTGNSYVTSYYSKDIAVLGFCTKAGDWTGGAANSTVVGANYQTHIRSSSDNLYHYHWTNGANYKILDANNWSSVTGLGTSWESGGSVYCYGVSSGSYLLFRRFKAGGYYIVYMYGTFSASTYADKDGGDAFYTSSAKSTKSQVPSGYRPLNGVAFAPWTGASGNENNRGFSLYVNTSGYIYYQGHASMPSAMGGTSVNINYLYISAG